MKKAFLFLSIMFVVPSVKAQTTAIGAIGNEIAKFAPLDTIDQGRFECIYQCEVTDPELDFTKTSYRILISGDKFSKYMDYNSYRKDSTFNTMDKSKITNNEFDKIDNKYYPSEPDFVLRNKEDGGLTVYDRIFIDNYKYTEPQPEFSWQLFDDTKTVCGNVCHKAVCDFRGRNWTVWYSDIPVSEGPWKFCGLPGLILEAEDSTKEISFTAISIRNTTGPLTEERKDFFKTTRERFNKAKQDYMNDPGKVISASSLAPRDANGNKVKLPKSKRFYNPIEKE